MSQNSGPERVKPLISDNDGYEQVEEMFTKRLEFEMLLSNLSTKFIDLPVEKIDDEIEQGLKDICQFLVFDRGTLHQAIKNSRRSHLTHSWATKGLQPSNTIKEGVKLEEIFPCASRCIKNQQIFMFSDINDLPSEASRDKKAFKKYHIASNITLPLFVEGDYLGALAFGSMVQRRISDFIVQRLRLAGSIFSNALMRKKQTIALQKAFSEIAILKDRLEAECVQLREEARRMGAVDHVIGQSEAIQRVLEEVRKVATVDTTVLITGETGTGKELIANAIHAMSLRKDRPLVKVDCASLPQTLIESELFGHEKGAFTGAYTRKIGKFEFASQGTVFLDEIGELPLQAQSRLLRVIQENRVERIGGNQIIEVNTRIIAATNRVLEKETLNGTFREDLLYRLNVFQITVPPLRERKEDIPILVYWFVAQFNKRFRKNIQNIPQSLLKELQNHDWPGNIRELENCIERAVINNEDNTTLLPNSVNFGLGAKPSQRHSNPLSEVERTHILDVLRDCNWKIEGAKGAAEILDMKPSTLRDRLKKLKITKSMTYLHAPLGH